MATGNAYFGLCRDTYVFRLEGEIRYTMVAGLDDFLDELLGRGDFTAIVIDARALALVDSTALGLLARIGNFMLKQRGRRAVIICNPGDLETSLMAVGFDEVFELTHEPLEELTCPLCEVPRSEPDERGVARVVLEAHRELIDASDRNRETFGRVVDALEQELRDAAGDGRQ